VVQEGGREVEGCEGGCRSRREREVAMCKVWEREMGEITRAYRVYRMKEMRSMQGLSTQDERLALDEVER
jgi:hypothetical protein